MALLRRTIETDVEVPERETLLLLALPELMKAGRRETILTELRRASAMAVPGQQDVVFTALIAAELEELDRPTAPDLGTENLTAQGEPE
jgi:hypothetical protein